jgi:hypothetical protein
MLNLAPHWRHRNRHEVETTGNGRRTDSFSTLQDRYAENTWGSPCRDCAPRGRIQETVHAQSSKTWPKTEAEIRLFPRPCRRRLELGREVVFADQSLVGQTLPDYLRDRQLETTTIIKVFPVVATKHLLVDIPKEMERLDADVGAVQATFQEAPEILDSICVDVAADVFERMVVTA